MWSSMLATVLVLAVLTVVPGPDVAVVTRVTLRSARRQAPSAAVGAAAGCLVWGVLTTAGLAGC